MSKYCFFKPDVDFIEKNEFPDFNATMLRSMMKSLRPKAKTSDLPEKVLSDDAFFLTHTYDKNFGLHTKIRIPADTPVLEYIGVYSYKTSNPGESAYVMENKEGIQIDAEKKGNLARYVNHSCQPNCYIRFCWDGSLPRFFIIADEDIQPGEEITYDYGYEIPYNGTNMICRCGSDRCRKFIGRKKVKITYCEDTDDSDSDFETENLQHSPAVTGPHDGRNRCRRIFKRRNEMSPDHSCGHVYCGSCFKTLKDKRERDKHVKFDCCQKKPKLSSRQKQRHK